jgi:hypothetical protein
MDMLVEIYACNYDSQDGLVNGVDGVVKAYTKTNSTDVLWIKFHDPLIGHRQENKLAYLYNLDTPHNWTPVLCIAKPISMIAKTGQVKIQKQFPIQLACARTMHRSQGLTLDSVAFDPTGIQKHGLVYTTLSHVKNIESLYFLNALTHENFRVKQKVDIEMQRLHSSAKWVVEYDSQSIQSESCISIFSLNTCNLNAHIDDIVNDYDIMQSDILCLQETYMTMCMENEQFQNFNCISNCIEHGVMILVKKYIPILEHMHFEEQNVEALLTKEIVHGSQIAILNIYVAPHATLTSILEHYCNNVAPFTFERNHCHSRRL